MKGKLYKSVKSREEIESSQLFSTMLQKVGSTGAVVIDGKNLMADSIYARHIQSKQITTDHLVVGVATADLINTGGLEITDELKVVHGDKDVLFINRDGVLEMNISALKIGLVDFEKDINTEIKAIAGSWSQLNLNNAGDIISGINANDKGTNIHGKNISLTGDTDVQGDFRVSGNQVILNADTDIRGDFKVSGGSVVLDANTDIRGDFTVSGNKVVLDAETTVLDTFTVKGDMLASNLDVEQLTIRAKNGLQNVLHIDSTGRVELNVDRFHIKAIDVESELANRATKEEVEGIGLADKTGILSGTEIYTDKADDSVVHVEIDGKSYQGGEPTPDHPIEIHSLNDFDVVSQKSEGGTIDGIEVGGRNLLKDGLTSADVSISKQSDGSYKITNPSKSSWGRAVSHPIVLEPNQEYTFSMEVLSRTGRYAGMALRGDYSKNLLRISTTKGKVSATYKNTTTSSQTVNIWIQLYYSDTDYNILIDNASIHIRGLQVEKGNKATDWTPAPEDITEDDNHPLIDKINLSLGEPLRSVGDVHDRLFRDDSNGLWKIERNVGERIVDGGGWFVLEQRLTNSYVQIYMDTGGWNKKVSSSVRGLSDRFLDIIHEVYSGDNPTMGIYTHNGYDVIRFKISLPFIGMVDSNSNAEILSAFKNWLGNNNTKVIYELANPTIETLDEDLQDKLNNLRSFQDSNYVYILLRNEEGGYY